MTDVAENVITRKINRLSVGRSPITQINQIGENFAGILDENMNHYLRCLTSSIILECEVKRLTQVLEELPVPAMIAIVDVDGCESKALVSLENDLIFHVVDLKMGGDPEVSPSPVARGISDIDTAICRGFIDILLRCLGEAVKTGLDAPRSPALSINHFEQHVAMVRIAPENADVLTLNVSLDIGDAARNGAVDVILPLSVLDHFITGAKSGPVKVNLAQQNDRWSRHMAKAAANSTIRLTSVLHRSAISVQTLKDLAPGHVFPIPNSAASEIDVFVEGIGSAPVARGRLGAFDGRKALKLSVAPDPAVLRRMAEMIEPPTSNDIT